MNYIGDFAEDSTVRIVLTTNNASGGAVAPSSAFEADDFRIYKNGSATQKTTTNGVTIASPFDSVTGLHTLTIDTSNDTGDTGFWTTAADYWVVAVPDETVDSQTVVQPIAAFSIQNRYMRGTDGANTTTPPTAAANATAVRSELTTELGRIDAAVSSRLAAASYTAPPSASSNATAVRSELATELGRIDVATSTRLASASYTAPDNASIASILSGVNTLLGRIPSTLFSGITYLSRWLGAIAGKTADTTTRTEINATTGGANYNETTDSLEAIRDRGDTAWTTGGASDTGARTVSIKVTLDGSDLEGAIVRLTKGAETKRKTTNATGDVSFSCDDGTWQVSITAANTDFEPENLIVNGDEIVEYDLSPTTATPSDPPYITGTYIALDSNHVPASGISFSFYAAKPTTLDGYGQKNNVRTTTSGTGGLTSFTNLLPGTKYKIRRGTGEWYTVEIPADQTTDIDLTSLIGN